nr:S24 family peptidase [uncultured Porphyromonas sp.]
MAQKPPIDPKHKIQIKRRLLKIYESLVSRDLIESYSDLAEKLEINVSTVRGAFSIASEYLSHRFLDRFLDVYGKEYSSDWLYDGIGNMRTKLEVDPDEASGARWKRVAYVIEQEGYNVQDFAKEIGLTHPSTIYRALQNKTRPSNNTMQLIYERFPEYGREWLLWGRGEVYIKPVQGPEANSAEPYKMEEIMEFPIIPDAAVAGRLTGYGDPDPEGLQTLTVPVDRRYKGRYYIFTVRGASMDDGTTNALCDGDKVLCREVAREYWSLGLHRRSWYYFVFATYSEGIIIKKVIDQDLENDTITCHSLNPEYPDIVLHLKDIIGVYNVVELVSRSMKY